LKEKKKGEMGGSGGTTARPDGAQELYRRPSVGGGEKKTGGGKAIMGFGRMGGCPGGERGKTEE